MTIPVRQWLEKMRTAHERADQEELTRLRAMTQEERVQALQRACRTAQLTLAAMTPEQRQRALEHVEPLPESSRAAIKRLQLQARARGRT